MGTCRNITVNYGLRGLVPLDSARATVVHRELESDAKRVARLRAEIEAETAVRIAAAVGAEREKWSRRLSAVEGRLDGFVRDVEAKVARQLIELSLKAAEIIVRRQLPDRDMLKDIIRETLEPLSDVQGVRVRLNPQDAEDVKDARAEAGPQGVADHVEIVADSSLARGDALIESRNGYFDARIGERLKLLEERLVERYKNATARSDA